MRRRKKNGECRYYLATIPRGPSSLIDE